MKPFVDSSDIVLDGAALDRRMKRDGYLFIKACHGITLIPTFSRQGRRGSRLHPH